MQYTVTKTDDKYKYDIVVEVEYDLRYSKSLSLIYDLLTTKTIKVPYVLNVEVDVELFYEQIEELGAGFYDGLIKSKHFTNIKNVPKSVSEQILASLLK